MAKSPSRKRPKRKKRGATLPMAPVYERVDMPREVPATLTAAVVMKFPDVCELWGAGKSMHEIAQELDLRSGPALWRVISKDPALLTVLEPYRALRAHSFSDQTITWAYSAANRGDYRLGIETLGKAAARLHPEEYGEVKRVEARDKNGRLIGSTKEVSSASPGEAYERMLRQA